jgi:hypothetical protein
MATPIYVAAGINPTSIVMVNGGGISFGTSTGTIIGTTTSQKFAFWGATAIAQPTGDVTTALTNLGLVASPTINANTLLTFTWAAPGTIGSTTPNTGKFTTLAASGQITSTVSTGTAPFVVSSTTNVANLNASSLNGATFAAPGPIGSTTASSGAFTTVSASGQITSTVSTGTAPFVVASTTNVVNLNASYLLGNTWAVPAAIGTTTPNSGSFTTLTASGLVQTAASAAGTAGLNLPPGAAPTSPNNGDAWVTSTGFFVRIAGVTDNLVPMTTLGDTIYGGASGTPTRLAGNTTATRQFHAQTGTGSVSAAPVWTALAASDIPVMVGATGVSAGTAGAVPAPTAGQQTYVLTGAALWAPAATVTSVAMTVPSFLSVSGSPITTSGTLAVSLVTQAANLVLAGPSSGSAAVPTFRNLTYLDVPTVYRAPAVVLVASNISLSAPPATVDGVALSTGNRILLGAQTVGSQNGLWTYNGPSSALTRTADFPSGSTTAAYYGVSIPVLAGATYGGTAWFIATTGAITIDTTSISFDSIGYNVAYSAVGILPIGAGGTGQNTAAAGFNALSPMTTLGDTIYGGASGAATRLAGNTTATRMFHAQTGTGSVSAAPVWTALSSTDIPALAYVTSVAMTVPSFLAVGGSPITSSGTLAVSLATQAANTFFAGPTSGAAAAPTFRLPINTELPVVYKVSVVALSAANVSITSAPATMDGVTLVSGNRILLGAQTTGSQNGIWVFNGTGSALTRPTDYPSGSTTMAFYGMAVAVQAGTTYGGTVWFVATTGAITIDTTSVSWDSLSYNVGTAAVGILPIAAGGTGANTASVAFNNLSPLTTLGDILYAGAGGTDTRLAGNTTTTRQFLSQTGTGSVSAAPAWIALAASDIPSLAGSIITSGTVGVGVGGTGLSGSSAADGTLLIGNGTGYTLATLTAGTGIAVTNGSGSISVAVAPTGAGTNVSAVFGQDATKTVASTAAKTSIVGTGIGSMTIPANTFIAGRTCRVTQFGYVSNVATDTLTWTIAVGANTIASAATAIATAYTSVPWSAEFYVTCYTTGTGGTCWVRGRLTIFGTSTTVVDIVIAGTATVALNTTITNLIDSQVTWSASSATNTITSVTTTAELVN